MVAIENTLLSDELFEEYFICDLAKCKGACCQDGDVGAPILAKEIERIEKALPIVLPLLPSKNKNHIQKNGFYEYDDEFGNVTQCLDNNLCVFGVVGKNGALKCSFEIAYEKGLTDFKKPISCHLFPIRISDSNFEGKEFLNFEPRETSCASACILGMKLKIPVFLFLKEPLIRKYGDAFFKALEGIFSNYFNPKNKKLDTSLE